MKKTRVIPHTEWAAPSLWSARPATIGVLLFALTTLGIGEGLLVLADLGSAPWTVLSQGLALKMDVGIGWASLVISILVMLAWFPLQLNPGLGTLLNVIVIAFFLGLTTKSLSPPTTLFSQMVFCSSGILLYGLGTALYLTCHLGSGPRDGLMVGICQRFHWKVGAVRTSIEVTVCLLGFLLGGTVGLGTLLFAACIGWVVQFCLTLIGQLPHFSHERDNLS